jgi:hypothetical protein
MSFRTKTCRIGKKLLVLILKYQFIIVYTKKHNQKSFQELVCCCFLIRKTTCLKNCQKMREQKLSFMIILASIARWIWNWHAAKHCQLYCDSNGWSQEKLITIFVIFKTSVKKIVYLLYLLYLLYLNPSLYMPFSFVYFIHFLCRVLRN